MPLWLIHLSAFVCWKNIFFSVVTHFSSLLLTSVRIPLFLSNMFALTIKRDGYNKKDSHEVQYQYDCDVTLCTVALKQSVYSKQDYNLNNLNVFSHVQ